MHSEFMSGIRDWQAPVISRLALLTTVGLVLFIFESLIPRPLPWLKPGLANAASLLALYLYGLVPALVVAALRVVLGSLILGSFFNPVFIFSLGGAVVATVMMGLGKRFSGQHLSVVGISVLGAFAHNLTQAALAYFWVVKRSEMLYLLPMMLLSSIFTGFVVGVLCYFVMAKGCAADIFAIRAVQKRGTTDDPAEG